MDVVFLLQVLAVFQTAVFSLFSPPSQADMLHQCQHSHHLHLNLYIAIESGIRSWRKKGRQKKADPVTEEVRQKDPIPVLKYLYILFHLLQGIFHKPNTPALVKVISQEDNTSDRLRQQSFEETMQSTSKCGLICLQPEFLWI